MNSAEEEQARESRFPSDEALSAALAGWRQHGEDEVRAVTSSIHDAYAVDEPLIRAMERRRLAGHENDERVMHLSQMVRADERRKVIAEMTEVLAEAAMSFGVINAYLAPNPHVGRPDVDEALAESRMAQEKLNKLLAREAVKVRWPVVWAWMHGERYLGHELVEQLREALDYYGGLTPGGGVVERDTADPGDELPPSPR